MLRSASASPAGSSAEPPARIPGEVAAKAGRVSGPEPKHEIAVVVLTQGTRPTELARAIASVRAQQQVDPQLVLVVNGAAPPQVDRAGSAHRAARERGDPRRPQHRRSRG